MKIGTMRIRLEVQSSTATQDAMGQPVVTWATSSTKWASVDPLNSRELYFSKTVRPEVTHKIRMRYFAGLLNTMRLKRGNKIYDIAGILNIDERNISYEIDAVERVA